MLISRKKRSKNNRAADLQTNTKGDYNVMVIESPATGEPKSYTGTKCMNMDISTNISSEISLGLENAATKGTTTP